MNRCSRFLDLARQSFVLKVVNFQNISMEDYEKHQHENDLLCLCARAGNLAAECRLGKAILNYDDFFLSITLKHDAPLSTQNANTNGVLIRHKLVRAFIPHASEAEFDRELICSRLISHINSVLGYDVVSASRMGNTLHKMSCYYMRRYIERISSYARNVPLGTGNSTMPRLKPETGVLLHENLLAVYDEMLP